MKNKPNKKELFKYRNDIEGASLFYKKSERTIRRWLKSENLYNPNINYKPNKLSRDDALKIRNKYNQGINQVNLAKEYNVSQACIANIINFKTYKTNIKLGGEFGYNYSTNFRFN